jgi:hypothetical protein
MSEYFLNELKFLFPEKYLIEEFMYKLCFRECLCCREILPEISPVNFLDRHYCSVECLKNTSTIKGLKCVICFKPFVEPRDNYGTFSCSKVVCSYDCKNVYIKMKYDELLSTHWYCPCSKSSNCYYNFSVISSN